MKKLYIKSCSDPRMWYASKIGSTVPYLGGAGKCCKHMAREDTGHINFVEYKDADIVDEDFTHEFSDVSEARFTEAEAGEYLGMPIEKALQRWYLKVESYPIEALRIIKHDIES